MYGKWKMSSVYVYQWGAAATKDPPPHLPLISGGRNGVRERNNVKVYGGKVVVREVNIGAVRRSCWIGIVRKSGEMQSYYFVCLHGMGRRHTMSVAEAEKNGMLEKMARK